MLNPTATAKDSFVMATEACVAMMKDAKNARELEIFRNTAAKAESCYRDLACAYYTQGDKRRDERLTHALGSLLDTLCDQAPEQTATTTATAT